MRFLSTLFAALLGTVPGVLLMAIGQIVTGGGEVMLTIGLGGVALTFIGFVVGAIIGWKRPGWLTGRGAIGAAVGMVPGLVLWQMGARLELVGLVIVLGLVVGCVIGLSLPGVRSMGQREH